MAHSAQRLRRSLQKNRRGTGEIRRYDSIDEMIRARQKVSDLSTEAARLICERGARHDGSGFAWGSDPALNWVSPIVMSDAQALDVLMEGHHHFHMDAPGEIAETVREFILGNDRPSAQGTT